MNKPTVSVMIPIYNYGTMIGEAIESVLAQTFTNYELIIVDNASTDNTEEVVKKYLHDPRVIYHKNASNIGLVGNWDKCLDLATGKYIKFLCADDIFHPQILDRFVTIMEEYTNLSLIACFRQTFGDESKVLKIALQHYQKGRDMIHSTINTYSWLGEPSSTMFRNADIKRVGKFDPNKHQFIDLDMWIRLLTVGDCYVIPDALINVRMHSAQITTKNLKNCKFTLEDYELFKELSEGKTYNIDVSDMNIDVAVKQKAVMCAKVMYKMVTRLHHKENRESFKKAYRIAKKEDVLFTPIIDLIKRRTAIRDKQRR